jgi:hypothetical protein
MPANVSLTVRSKDPSRPTHPDPVWFEQGGAKDLTPQRILLLVHGYATPQEEAHSSYEKFIDSLMAVSESFPGTWGAVCEFHWPGDDPRGELISKGTYSLRIEVAISSADHLVTFLHEKRYLTRKHELYIVAHSLGCRLTLEALRKIGMREEYNGPVVREVALLAAAVPVVTCLPGSGSFQPIGEEHEHVFYSRRDTVLRNFFGSGQRIIGERGKAVGREGMPPKRWQTRTSTGLKHGEYWGKYAVAKRVSTILCSGPIELPEHYPAEVEFDIADPPRSRVLAERLLGRRR